MCSQILVSVLSQLHPPKFQSLPGWVNFWSFIREYVSINSLSIHPSISIYHSLFSYLYLISFCYLRLYLYIYVYTQSRWWFQTFFMLNLTWGNDPIWLIFFKWAETTNQQYIHHSHVPLLPPITTIKTTFKWRPGADLPEAGGPPGHWQLVSWWQPDIRRSTQLTSWGEGR